MTTTLSSKGQIVIPSEIRKKLALSEGTTILCELVDGKIILDPEPGKMKAILRENSDRPVLIAPEGAPEITPEMVNKILNS